MNSSTDGTGIEQINDHCIDVMFVFLQSLCVHWNALAGAHAKTVFGHLNQKICNTHCVASRAPSCRANWNWFKEEKLINLSIYRQSHFKYFTVDFNSLWPRGFGNILRTWELRSWICSFIVIRANQLVNVEMKTTSLMSKFNSTLRTSLPSSKFIGRKWLAD